MLLHFSLDSSPALCPSRRRLQPYWPLHSSSNQTAHSISHVHPSPTSTCLLLPFIWVCSTSSQKSPPWQPYPRQHPTIMLCELTLSCFSSWQLSWTLLHGASFPICVDRLECRIPPWRNWTVLFSLISLFSVRVPCSELAFNIHLQNKCLFF